MLEPVRLGSDATLKEKPHAPVVGIAISDEGSGHWIGKRAVTAAMRARDQGASSNLLDNLLKSFGIGSPDELVLTANASPPADFAKLFPAVMIAAEAGDAMANSVLVQAGDELSELAHVVIARLFPEKAAVPVAMSGGVFHNSRQVRETFISRLNALCSGVARQCGRGRSRPGRPGAGSKMISDEHSTVEADENIPPASASDLSLTEDLALAWLKRSDLPAPDLERLSKNPSLAKSRKLKLALIEHPRTPRHLSLSLLRHLYTFDLMAVALMPVVAADIKIAVEEALINRLETISTGERMSLARRASARVVAALLGDDDMRVVNTALENSRLTEAMVAKALLRCDSARLAGGRGWAKWQMVSSSGDSTRVEAPSRTAG